MGFTDMPRCSCREDRGRHSWNFYCKLFTVSKLYSYLPQVDGEAIARYQLRIIDEWTIRVCGLNVMVPSLYQIALHEEYNTHVIFSATISPIQSSSLNLLKVGEPFSKMIKDPTRTVQM